MKKLLLLLISILTLSLTMFVGACDAIVDVSSIEFYKCPENVEYEINGFNYNDFSLLVKYTDGSEKIIPLSEDMISIYDRTMLNEVGTHSIKISYDMFYLTLDVKTTYKQSSADGETFEPALEYYEATYDGQYHYVNVTGDLPGNYTVYYPNGNSYKNAGTYTCQAVVSCEGFETITLYSQVLIKRATYDMSDVKLYVDYGTTTIEPDEDSDEAPQVVENTSFVYDGEEYSATLTGSIPEGLSAPEYYIGLSGNAFSTYEKGKSATNAGTYIVYAIFTGDSENYLTDNLTIQTTLIIDKKPISQDFIDGLEFNDKKLTYDGKKHRLVIENLQLPDGITVEYVDENGNPFESKIDANEEGYLVTAKFISDNPNYDITNTKSARLYIYKASYITGEVSVLIDGTSSEITYDGLEHYLKPVGVSELVQIKSMTCNENEISSLTDAGIYSVHVEFEDIGDNYTTIDPVDVTLTINKADFGNFSYEFEGLTVDYDENEYSINYIEYHVPVGVTHTLTYMYDKEGVVKEGTPQNVKEVGVYQSYLKYNYNPNNYTNAPDTLDSILATLTINTREYDAKNIIKLDDIRVVFEANVNRISLCGFDEVLPSWVDSSSLIVRDPNGDRTSIAINAGEYTYQYEFWYFNGLKRVSVLSNEALLKIIGLQINASDYKLTYKPTGAYDGTTSYLPTCVVYMDSSLNPKTNVEYKFLEYNSELAVTVDAEDYEDYSKRAGFHTFNYTISAYNYEPLKISITIEVSRQTIVPSKYTYVVKDYTCDYDGENHGNQLTIDEATQNENIGCDIVLTSDLQTNQISGVDVGTYFYKVQFNSLDPNYVVVVESSAVYSYKVIINSVDVVNQSEYDLVSFVHSTSNFTKNVDKTESYSEDNTNELYKLAKKFGTKTSDTTYSVNYIRYTCDYLNGEVTANVSESSNNIVNICFENDIKYTLFSSKDDSIYQSLSLDDLMGYICDAGDYYLFVETTKNNIKFNGKSAIAYMISIAPCQVTVPNPCTSVDSTNTDLIPTSISTFNLGIEGLSMLYNSNVSSFSSFNDATLLSYEYSFDGSTLYYLLNEYFDQSATIFNQQTYLACKSFDGLLISNTSETATIFNYSDGIFTCDRTDELQTDAGIYYLFIDLGYNYTYNGESKYVIKVTVNVANVTITSVVSISDGSLLSYDSETRLYGTEKEKLLYTLDGEPYSAINNADNIQYCSIYNGYKVYSLNVTYNSSKSYTYKFFEDSLSKCFANEKFNIVTASSLLLDGGKTISSDCSMGTYNGIGYSSLINNNFVLDTAGNSGASSCGVYYLFATILSDNVTVNGDKYFVICLKVDRGTDLDFTYLGITYSLTDFMPPSYYVDYSNTQTEYTYELNDQLKNKIEEKFGNCQYTFSKYTTSTPTNFYNIIGNHTITADITLDAYTYAGLTIGMSDTNIVVNKINVFLKGTYWGNTFRYSEDGVLYQLDKDWNSNVTLDDIKNRVEDSVLEGLTTIIGYDNVASEFYKETYECYTSGDFTTVGEKTVYFEFSFSNLSALSKCLNVYCDGYSFDEVETYMSSFSMFTTKGTTNEITVVIEKYREPLIISTGYVIDNWAQDCYDTSDPTDPTNLVCFSYLFMGWSNLKNDFLDNIPSDFDVDLFIENCITIRADDYFTNHIYVTLQLTDEFDKYTFEEHYYYSNGTYKTILHARTDVLGVYELTVF